MTFLLPGQQKRWNQPNNSDRFGSLSYTRGIDFDKEGYLKLAKRSRSIMDSGVDAQFGFLIGIEYNVDDSQFYYLTADQIFYSDNLLQTFTQDVTANVPTTLGQGSDIVVFDGAVHVSAGVTDDLRKKNGASWTTSQYTLSSNVAPMAIFENQNALAVAQDNTVLLLDTAYTLLETLTIPSAYRITTMAYSNNRLYIGTRNRFEGEAMMFEWDGNTASANNAYPCGSVRIESIKAYQSTIVAFTGIGQLLAFTGGGFQVLANHPLYYTDFLISVTGSTIAGITSHRGMVVDGDIIYVNVRAEIQTSGSNTAETEFHADNPGGVWCYDPKLGFYQRHSLSAALREQTDAVTTANVATGTEIVTVAGATVPASGTPVFYDNGASTSIAGLVHRKKYYVIYVSDTTMKLATTRALALLGTAIDLTGTGNNAQFFVFVNNQDFGGDKSAGSTAIRQINIKDPVRTDGMSLLFGGTVGKTTITEVQTLNTIADKQENRGAFITSVLDAEGIKDKFNRIAIPYRNVTDPADKIVVKIKTIQRDDKLNEIDTALEQTGTWSDDDTFTSTADLSQVQAGDEVTVHSGAGMGYTAHISSISEAGGTYTVNLDETFENIVATNTMVFSISNWEKVGTITTADNDTTTNDLSDTYDGNSGTKSFSLEKAVSRMLVKVEMRGCEVEIEDVLVNNKPFNTYVV